LSGSNLPVLHPGHVVVSTAQPGVIARVKTVTAQNGQLVLTTEPAGLTDVIQQGRIEFKNQLNLAQATVKTPTAKRPAAKFDIGSDGISLSDLSMNLNDQCSLTVTDGRIDFNPDFDFVMDIQNAKITTFKCVASGIVTVNLDVKFDATEATSNLSKDMTLVEVESSPYFVTVGLVPIEYRLFMNIKIGAGLTIGDAGSVSGGFDFSTGLRAGAIYENSRWNNLSEFILTANPHIPVINVHPLEAEIYLKPEFGVKFFESTSASISLKDYLKLIGDYRQETLGAEIRKGDTVDLNFEFKTPRSISPSSATPPPCSTRASPS